MHAAFGTAIVSCSVDLQTSRPGNVVFRSQSVPLRVVQMLHTCDRDILTAHSTPHSYCNLAYEICQPIPDRLQDRGHIHNLPASFRLTVLAA